MTEEPYRWLEAMQNRRDYIEDQLRTAAPVIVISGAPGFLLLTQKASTPKFFEIYDHLALACLGHPADIEKLRQAAIDTAHVEGFTRSPHDVSARRLVSYALSPALKNAFEQIYASPMILRALLLELAPAVAQDHVWTMNYDGSFGMIEPASAARGVLLTSSQQQSEAWQRCSPQLSHDALADSWPALTTQALRLLAFTKIPAESDPLAFYQGLPAPTEELQVTLGHPVLEIAHLDRAHLATGFSFQRVNP
jgi:proteasome alpha subunit